MNTDWLNNDTIALIALLAICATAVCFGAETIASVAVGAVGGYIGSKTL